MDTEIGLYIKRTDKKTEQAKELPFSHIKQSMSETRRVLMGDHEYLRRKANRCYQIARECMDLEAARKINELGNELRSKADDEQSGPQPLLGGDRDVAA